MKIQLSHSFEDIISLENLFLAWDEFLIGKKSKPDVLLFEQYLSDNIISLNEDLASQKYCHGEYESFFVNDPKRRHIHKANVRDRLLHHAIYRKLYPFFDKTFIPDSYSCRIDKGTHRAIRRFHCLSNKVSQNNHRTCWVLKCDIRKFFASIDHEILLDILKNHIPDKNIVLLLKNIIDSYHSDLTCGAGLPLGNLTSQLFANVYMNVFDQWIKHCLKAKYYIRYADDFVILSDDKKWLESIVPLIKNFLLVHLKLDLHPDKLFIKTISSGVDFLGWKQFARHRALRTVTKHRMLRRIKEKPGEAVVNSYLGLLKHGNAEKIRWQVLEENKG